MGTIILFALTVFLSTLVDAGLIYIVIYVFGGEPDYRALYWLIFPFVFLYQLFTFDRR